MSTLRLKKRAAAQPAPTASRPRAAPLDADHFFFLWRFGSGRPTQRHASLQAATTERDRLTKEYPGTVFYVFEAKRVPV